jgi:GNAT superfamily N-acetyltransferase
MFDVAEVSGPERSLICGNLIALLPDWFGLPAANAHYVSGVADLTCFGAYTIDGNCIGMVATRLHFDTTLEIWWMAVNPGFHRLGAGAELMKAVESHARRLCCDAMVLMTLSDESDDVGYAATRGFYGAQGFHPLVREHMSDADDPLMWMIRRLG